MGQGHKQIGEVAERTGLSLRTIRYYEEMGLISPSARSQGGFRLYTEADIARLELVTRMKPLDFTLEEMRDLLATLDRIERPADEPGRARAPLDRLVTYQSAVEERLREPARPAAGGRGVRREPAARGRAPASRDEHAPVSDRSARRPRTSRSRRHAAQHRRHLPPRRRQVDAHRGARAARPRDQRGRRRARQGRPVRASSPTGWRWSRSAASRSPPRRSSSPYGDIVINLVDTPGHADFSEDTYRVLTAVDAAVMLLDAAKGLEPQTLKLFEVCRHRGDPRHHLHQQVGPPGQGRARAVRRARAAHRPAPDAGHLARGRRPGDFRGLLDRRDRRVHARTTRTAGGADARAEERT